MARTFYKTLAEAEAEAAKRTGAKVLPAEAVDGPPGQYVLGQEIKAISFDEVLARHKAKMR